MRARVTLACVFVGTFSLLAVPHVLQHPIPSIMTVTRHTQKRAVSRQRVAGDSNLTGSRSTTPNAIAPTRLVSSAAAQVMSDALAAAAAQAALEERRAAAQEERLPAVLRRQNTDDAASESFEGGGPPEFGTSWKGGCVIRPESDAAGLNDPLPGTGASNQQGSPLLCCHSCMRHPHCVSWVHEADNLSCHLSRAPGHRSGHHPLRTSGLALNPEQASKFLAARAVKMEQTRVARLKSEQAKAERIQELLFFPANSN